MNAKRITALVKDLEEAKARQMKVHESHAAIGAQVNAAQAAEQVELDRLAALRADLTADPIKAVEEIQAANQRLQGHREHLAALAPIAAASAERFHRGMDEASGEVKAALQALVEQIGSQAGDSVDEAARAQLRRGWAAVTLAGFYPSWWQYLVQVLPEPTQAELENLRAAVQDEYPVLQ